LAAAHMRVGCERDIDRALLRKCFSHR
jgi:hypothetical protein